MENLILANCGYENCASRHFFGPAVRDHLLIHYIVSGKGIYRRGKTTYQVLKGQIFIILPEEITYYEADEDDPWEYYWIGVKGNSIKDYIYDLNLNHCELVMDIQNTGIDAGASHYNNDYINVLHIFQILKEYFLSSHENPYSIAGYLNLLFSRIADVSGRRNHKGLEDVLEKAVNYLNNNYSYEVSIEELCGMLGISRGHFFRIFKRELGISPKLYLIHRRIEAACQLLKNSRLGITEIAYSSGFKDSAHFSRIFRTYMNLSPKEYRKQEK